jgi:tRNA (guanosine-2'-O-)-methyltransferase
VTRNLASTDLKRLHREWRRRPHGRLGVYLDSVETPANVGSILRTAAAMGVADVYLGGRTVEPSHPGAQRTAMGSERFVALHRPEPPVAGLAAPRAAGYRLVGLELAEGALPLHELDLTGDLCLVVGHEDRGLSKGTLEELQELAFIPQLGRIGSLNVAVATGIAFAEVRRQAWTSPSSPA